MVRIIRMDVDIVEFVYARLIWLQMLSGGYNVEVLALRVLQ